MLSSELAGRKPIVLCGAVVLTRLEEGYGGCTDGFHVATDLRTFVRMAVVIGDIDFGHEMSFGNFFPDWLKLLAGRAAFLHEFNNNGLVVFNNACRLIDDSIVEFVLLELHDWTIISKLSKRCLPRRNSWSHCYFLNSYCGSCLCIYTVGSSCYISQWWCSLGNSWSDLCSSSTYYHWASLSHCGMSFCYIVVSIQPCIEVCGGECTYGECIRWGSFLFGSRLVEFDSWCSVNSHPFTDSFALICTAVEAGDLYLTIHMLLSDFVPNGRELFAGSAAGLHVFNANSFVE